jgi:hypothetical protein
LVKWLGAADIGRAMCLDRKEKQEARDGRDKKLHVAHATTSHPRKPAPFGECGKKLVESGGGSDLSR